MMSTATENICKGIVMTVAIIMTVFNRMEQTKQCIQSLEIALQNVIHHYYITDDKSTDNTADYLENLSQKIDINVYQGNGDLYWNRGMYHSFEKALQKEYDVFLWVNNDTVFYENMWDILINNYRKAEPFSVICGVLQSAVSGETTYGGTDKSGLLNPCGDIRECTHINGNCLFIPKIVAEKIGNLDYHYEHSLGDFDYGQRILNYSGKLYSSSDYVGVCERNPIKDTWQDKDLPFLKRISLMKLKTGLPRKSYKRYLRKWNRKTWIFYYYKPYLDIFGDSIGKSFRRKHYDN
ncbi:MAG: glycosyltransferase family 2 protein [Clostridia bacterium]|nr:glycosyltransferase family 2 protein [Clostridia bacterium]